MVATPANAVNLTSAAGIVTFDGTSAVSTTSPTNHYVMVGSGGSSVTSVSPSTAGFVLTSNGTGSDPSFQIAGGSATFAPNSTINLFDDFMGSNTASGSITIGALAWATAMVQTAGLGDNAHPGVFGNVAISLGGFGMKLGVTSIGGGSIGLFVLGGGAITLNWIFKINTLSNSTNRYTLRLGIGDTGTGDWANGCYFEYSDNINSGSWNIKTAKASTRSTTSTATAVATGWHNAQISINAAGTSVTFTLDGSSLGTIATNLPTAAIFPDLETTFGAGTIAANTILVDLFYLNQTLTTPR